MEEDFRGFIVSSVLVSLLSERLDKILLSDWIWTVRTGVRLQALGNDRLCLNHQPAAGQIHNPEQVP